MNIVEKLTKIREEAGDDVYKKIEPVLNEITSGLRVAEIKATDSKGSIDSLYKEMKEAKEKESATRKELETAQKEIDSLKSDSSVEKISAELETIKKERDGLKQTVDGINKTRKERFVNSFKTYQDHADFEKIINKLKIPEKKDGEVVDWSKTPNEDIFTNIGVINDAESYGLFKEIKVPSTSKSGTVTPRREAGKGMFPKMSKHRS